MVFDTDALIHPARGGDEGGEGEAVGLGAHQLHHEEPRTGG